MAKQLKPRTRMYPAGKLLGEKDLEFWPAPVISALSSNSRAQYLARRSAVTDYVAGKNRSRIERRWKISIEWVRALLKKCLTTHSDGRLWGFRALVPHIRMQKAERKKPLKVNHVGRGAATCLHTTLQLEPEFRRKLDNFILKIERLPGGVKLPSGSYDDLQQFALKELRERGYEAAGRWPFGTMSLGYHAFRRYAIALLNENPTLAARRLAEPDKQKKLKGGMGADKPLSPPYGRIEMDAHKLDGRFVVLVPDQLGGHTPVILRRLWVIVLINTNTRAVLGYHLSLRTEVNSVDVLKAIRCAIGRWKPRKVTIPALELEQGEGLPQSLGEEFVGLKWAETSVDGALAEQSKRVKETLKIVVGSELRTPEKGFSSRHSLDDRPFIETYFRNLASGGLHKAPNTTGGKPSQRDGREPEKNAKKLQFSIEYLEELLQKLICQYNNERHSGLGYRSPLAYTKYLHERQSLSKERADQSLVDALLQESRWCTVKGGYKTGRQPYVNFENAIYSGKDLSTRHALVGQKVLITVQDEDDARTVLCATSTGTLVGTLKASAPWNGLPHSLAVRRAILSLKRNRVDFPKAPCAVRAMMKYCEENGGSLPPPPAYLEMRRILQDFDTSQQGNSGEIWHPSPQNSAQESPQHDQDLDTEVSSQANAESGRSPAQPASATSPEKRSLPARRLAQN